MSSHSSFIPIRQIASPCVDCLHLTQMKEKLGIGVISVDSGTVWGVDPLLRISDFDNAAELKGLKTKRPQLLKEK